MSDKRLLDIAREAAAESTVLLENRENALPLDKAETIALVGNGNFHFLRGGGGSAEVNCAHEINVIEGLSRCGARVVAKSLEKQEHYFL